jgi:hypothetical protein
MGRFIGQDASPDPKPHGFVALTIRNRRRILTLRVASLRILENLPHPVQKSLVSKAVGLNATLTDQHFSHFFESSAVL